MRSSARFIRMHVVGGTAALLFTLFTVSASTGQPLGAPFWSRRTMDREPILFVQREGAATASGRLLFTPVSKPVLSSPDLDVVYEEGRDYSWQPGSDTIALTASSRIPFKTASQMTPPPGSPNRLGGVLWAEGRFFHDLQMLADYEHAGGWNLPPPAASTNLDRIRATLLAREPVTVVALGDSITAGYNASGFQPTAAPPHQPAYPQLVADALGDRFGGPVTLVNLGRAGTVTGWGIKMVEKVAEAKPDLVILAFGMNHGEPTADYEAVMRDLLTATRSACPAADVILVASMTKNPRLRPASQFMAQRDALLAMATPGVAVADVTTPWLKLLETKAFADVSGNNVNHPNDFGHRLYAHTILALFGDRGEATGAH